MFADLATDRGYATIRVPNDMQPFGCLSRGRAPWPSDDRCSDPPSRRAFLTAGIGGTDWPMRSGSSRMGGC